MLARCQSPDRRPPPHPTARLAEEGGLGDQPGFRNLKKEAQRWQSLNYGHAARAWLAVRPLLPGPRAVSQGWGQEGLEGSVIGGSRFKQHRTLQPGAL